VVHLAVDPHEDLVQVPLQTGTCAHLADPFLRDLGGKQQAKSVPPKANSCVADLKAALVHQNLDCEAET
jgi:hypothetical protein